eukprot:m.10171 g.10171  ORF g.10171 m.10171 type:complete len:366 (+) comp4213_c0_seq1:249-1346(+)
MNENKLQYDLSASVVADTEDGWYMCSCTSRQYPYVDPTGKLKTFGPSKSDYCLQSSYIVEKIQPSSKRMKRDTGGEVSEDSYLQQATEKILQIAKVQAHLHDLKSVSDIDKQREKGTLSPNGSKQKTGSCDIKDSETNRDCVVSNRDKNDRIILLEGNPYLFPRGSSFILSDLQTVYSKGLLRSTNRKYDFIVVDPPWENKSARRGSKYSWVPAEDLYKLELPRICSKGSIVAFWVTNNERHKRFLLEDLFVNWGIKPLGEWYWIKICTSGEPLYPWASKHKKPYEPIIFGRFGSDPESGKYKSFPSRKAIVSVPSKEHSVKPCLEGIMKQFLPPSYHPLEIFARELRPNWTSFGNEVLKFQTTE